ncbi:MAG: hypothetical protein RBQ97_01050 [Acholeplasma sp.]|nr:hypothetical protein [Acholeplasma sp.]
MKINRINMTTRTMSILVILFGAYQQFIVKSNEIIVEFHHVILNAGALFVVTFLPSILERFKYEISPKLYSMLILSLTTSMIGGVTFKLYKRIKLLDKIVHLFNGALIAVFAFRLITMLFPNWNDKAVIVFISAAIISIAVGTVWEIYEFVVDMLLDNNMQRYQDVVTNEPFIGQAALYDTMFDIIADSLGAVLTALALNFSYRREGKLCNELQIGYAK